MTTIVITTGEPSGIGPDICLDIANLNQTKHNYIVIADVNVLINRATMLQKTIDFIIINDKINNIINGTFNHPMQKKYLLVWHLECPNNVIAGMLDTNNVPYVLKMLDTASQLCINHPDSILITAPIHKAIINQAGINFTGHTEYLANFFHCQKVVMMLLNATIKVALLTTHVALKYVPQLVTKDNLQQTLTIMINNYYQYCNNKNPKIAICGLNPHAGEDGYIGDEELTTISPVIKHFQQLGYNISGCYPADTIFLQANQFDAILAMYHDQGLPVLKYSDFANSINLTLGLPIIRLSVDHGTALTIAGSGLANSDSLMYAIKYAHAITAIKLQSLGS